MKHLAAAAHSRLAGLIVRIDDTSTATLDLERATVPDAAASPGAGTLQLTAVYQQWFRPVHRWIRALGGPNIEAEDLTQEVFIVVQRKLAQFDGGNLPGWLYRIAQLTVRDHRRRVWFRQLFQRAREVGLDELAAAGDGVDERLARKRDEARLYAMVQQINPRWREAFLLFEVAGLSGEEIAGLLKVPQATVRTHVARARKAMIALVAAHQAEEAR